MKTFHAISLPLLLLFSASNVATAQSLHINSTRFIGGDTTGITVIYYAIPTKDKGILFTGTTDCTGGGDIPSNPKDTVDAHPDGNLIVGKIDSNKNLLWLKVYGGSWYDAGWSACQTPDGGYAILGNTWSNDRDVSGNHYLDIGELWLVRIDKDGNLLWQKCFGSPGDDQPISIAVTPDSGFVLLGTSNSSGGDVPFHYGSLFSYDWFVVKTDKSGNKQWSKTYGGMGDEDETGSILVRDGYYYLVSESNSKDHDCVDTSWHPSGVNTKGDIYILKIDTAGNLIWSKSYGSSYSDWPADAIWDETDSSIVLAGCTDGNNYMIHDHIKYNDMLVMKIDTSGHLIWSKCYGSTTDEEATGITKVPGTGYLLYGNTFPTGGAIPEDIGQQDCWLFLIDSNGTELSNKIFGNTKYEWARSIAPIQQQFAALGFSTSHQFTEGTNNYGDTSKTETGFASFIDIWPVKIKKPFAASNKKQLIVYPNPGNSSIKIIYPRNETGEISISDISGKTVYKTNIDGTGNNNIEINTSTWNKGTYIITWDDEQGIRLTTKMIKN